MSPSTLSASMSSKMVSPLETMESQIESRDAEDELELRFDPMLNCYFDPVTHRYYELA